MAPRKVVSWAPFASEDDHSSPWVLDTFKTLATHAPFADGRVQLGFAIDNFYQPTEIIRGIFDTVRGAGAKLITSHGAAGVAFGNGPSTIQMLHKHGVLGPDVIVSHANLPKDEDPQLLRDSGASISTTPKTELQRGWPPLALRADMHAHASLGVDCHSWGTGYMPGQMRLLLQYARCERVLALAAKGQWSRHVGHSVEDVFNLGTVAGAKSIGMAESVGRIAVGMKADLVVFGTSSPSMLAAAQENPMAAVVHHSSERDVETVIVDGIVRMEAGQLVDVVVAEGLGQGSVDRPDSGKTLSWSQAAASLLESRARLNEKIAEINMDVAEEGVLDLMHMNRKTAVD